jgi:hypothetical protein
MPKNTVTDPITDTEMAFAHLLMSGTMTDREAAQAAGLNPETASYTKAKPRVRDYMVEHREAVAKKLVEQEAEGLRKLNLNRDQILTRLWELASLSPDATRGSITGQIKAMAMIVAIEGLIQKPDLAHRQNQTQNRTANPEEPLTRPQPQTEAKEPANAAVSAQAEPDSPRAPKTETPPKSAIESLYESLSQAQPGPLNPFVEPPKKNRVPDAFGGIFDAALDTTSSLRLPLSIKRGPLHGRR